MRFENLEEAQGYLDRWEQTWADTHIHGTTKPQVAAMFLEEKPHLLPLPIRKQAQFRDPQRTLDNFDFNFNRKMNRSLIFDLATALSSVAVKTRSS